MPAAACSGGEPYTMKKHRSAKVSLACRHASSAATIWRDAFSCIATKGLLAATGLRFLRACSAVVAIGAIMGFALENSSYCKRSGCSWCIHSASWGFTNARTIGWANVR